jgi:hypothetical protein
MTEPTEERWTIVQVAAYLSLSYQVARNNMLSGDYGPSDYDAETRRLTVSAERVRAAKSKRGRPRKRA